MRIQDVLLPFAAANCIRWTFFLSFFCNGNFVLSLTQPKVVVVGGGVGGLGTAARIAHDLKEHNVEVLVLEKNPTVGGRCGSFHVNIPPYGDFRHERGPSLLLLPDVYQKLFNDCGSAKTAEKYGLTMKPCNPAYQVVFDDGDNLMVGFRRNQKNDISEEEQLSRKKMDSFEDQGSQKWDEYMQACQAFLDCGLPNFIEERFDLQSFPSFLYQALRQFGKAWPLKPHSDVLEETFSSSKMRALSSFQDLYVGLEPYRNKNAVAGGVLHSTAPAVFGLLAAIELHPDNKKCGVFAPIGGFASVTTAMKNLCDELGVTIRFNQTVTSISTSGVTIRGEDDASKEIKADLVVVNADLPYAKKSLVADEKVQPHERYDWDDKYKFSSGVISFHWSINKTLDSLNTHNVFMQASSDKDARNSWKCIRDPPTGGIPFSTGDACNFYVHRPTKVDPSAAPEGCDSILILLPCSTLKRQDSLSKLDRSSAMAGYSAQFPPNVIDSARELVLARLAVLKDLQDLKQHIVHETVDTPASMADAWNVGAGTPFGLSHGFAQLSVTRPSSVPELPNTVFVGASSKPGNGVPLVLVGAEQSACRAVEALKDKI